MKLVAYIRGGLGDIWPAISALKVLCDREGIGKFDRLVITDSVYYFRDYPKEMEQYSLDMIRKLTPNIIEVPPWINDNFWLQKNGARFDDTTNELSQEEADKYMSEFMFWRPESLKNFVKQFLDSDTIFIDCLFTECIVEHNYSFEHKKEFVKRVDNDRAIFEFTPTRLDKGMIDNWLEKSDKHIIIPVRKKKEGDSHTTTDDFYQKIITWCNKNEITPMLIGIEGDKYEGEYSDMRGSDIFSFEGIAYLIDKCKVFLGSDSGLTAIKLYQQQKDTMTICVHPRWERRWYKFMENGKNKLFDAREDNFEKITKCIKEFYKNEN